MIATNSLRVMSIINKYRSYRVLREKQTLEQVQYRYLRDVEIALYSLNKRERFVFVNTYMIKHKENWYRPFFSKKEFIFTKTLACGKFLNIFYEIH